jgi:F0F1-type ATP synthase assembly protein I
MENDGPQKPSNPLSGRYKATMGAKYQGAMEAVLAVPIGAGLGHLADRQWESAPIGLIVGLVLGFGAFILRLVRMRPETPADPGSRPPPSDRPKP